jgi:osmotically-inducible protein OsmY
MNIRFHRMAASVLLSLAAGPFLLSPAQAAGKAQSHERDDAALVTSVQAALQNSLGSDAAELTVTASHHNVTLHGWINRPKLEAQAVEAASKVPGVKHTYSQVHTWSSRNDE